ncbi:CpaF family protein [Candidatus Pacearchaeota archaeon]|nr:MAG: CpaF family protein [Candidatus Pacearchaeota archaeon]
MKKRGVKSKGQAEKKEEKPKKSVAAQERTAKARPAATASKARAESEHAKEKHPKEKFVLESYKLEVDGAEAKVVLKQEGKGVTYNISFPEIGPATQALLDEIRSELVAMISVSMNELSDPEAFVPVKKRFIAEAKHLLNENLPGMDEKLVNHLTGILMQEMLGLGKIEFLIGDPSLEEIVIQSAKEPVKVYSKKYGWLTTNITIGREEEIVNYANIVARRVGRQITVLNPLLDAHLISGDRVNAVLYPIHTKGNTITIRKFARDPFTIIDMINTHTCDVQIAAMIWEGIEYEMNIIVSGGTGSGKTSFLNACMPFIPPNQRIITIEDTRELTLPEFLYWTPLVTRSPNPEGKGEVSMLHLLVNSLRMRPDRIILGEMRRQEEAMVLFEAMHTGHSVYATLHADSAPETISRLINPPLNVPANLLKAVNLNVVMFRDRKRGIRRVLQLAEVEAERSAASANIIYRWMPDSDKFVKHNESARFFEELSRNTGMSIKEIQAELDEKKTILNWLAKNNIRSLKQVGKAMHLYYSEKKKLLDIIKRNKKEAFD